ncbi:cupin domain-containing protein [Candidatus Micrarchaeota archaeon]|nr:cupin domain-containing protein [Candidatus Micrarchaeota archaeon]
MRPISIRTPGRIAKGSKLKSGCVHLSPGESVGEHSTESGEEIIVILKGQARVIANGNSIELKEEECVFLSQETKHNVSNIGPNNLVYIYVVGGK